MESELLSIERRISLALNSFSPHGLKIAVKLFLSNKALMSQVLPVMSCGLMAVGCR